MTLLPKRALRYLGIARRLSADVNNGDFREALSSEEFIPPARLRSERSAAVYRYSLAREKIHKDITYTLSEILPGAPSELETSRFNLSQNKPMLKLQENTSTAIMTGAVFSIAGVNNLRSVRLSVLRRQ